jgi:NAD-reducing hydrogenase large subunit
VLSVHALRFGIDGTDVRPLRAFAKLAMTAAGSPGHFPVTAVVGGVAAPADAASIARCREALPDALASALRLAEDTLARDRGSAGSGGTDFFDGAGMATTDDDGAPDLMGLNLRVAGSGRRVFMNLVSAAGPEDWESLVAETVPGDPAPRPYLRGFGARKIHYRVGPLAQIQSGSLTTPRAAGLQADWWAADSGALGARAVMLVHCVEVIGQVLDRIDPADTEVRVTVPPSHGWNYAGTGWVDGARGMLVHQYRVTSQNTVRAAIVLTPTAQNEYWLAGLLRAAIGDVPDGPLAAGPAVEDAIRDADPCLPCSAAPPGTMNLTIETVPPGSLDAGGE